MEMNMGMKEEDRVNVAEGLSKMLADTYTLYLKTHNFHWNVTGPMFQTLHLLFETQYNELALAVDLIAERIRALGFPAPAHTASLPNSVPSKKPRGAESGGDDPSARGGSRSGGANRTRRLPGRGKSGR